LIFSIILVFIVSLTMISCPASLEVWTITFDSNGGSTVSEQQVSSKIEKPNNPSKRGFVLEGWYLDEGLTDKWDFASDTEGDRTLFAKWVDDYLVIRPSDNAENDYFGRDVAISEDTAIVSSINGSVYIFVRDGITWTQQQKLEVTNEDDVARNFGYSVDISGDTAIVGVAAGSTNAGASGSASIFTREDGVWTLEQRITVDLSLPNGDPDLAQFGSAVAIEGDNVVVGAPYALIGSSYSGYAYVFERVDGVWSEKQRLKDSSPNSYSFGSGVDIWEDTIVIGSEYSSSTTPCKAIVFRTGETGWMQEASFEISEYVDSDSRVAVAIAEDTVVLGSPSEDKGRVLSILKMVMSGVKIQYLQLVMVKTMMSLELLLILIQIQFLLEVGEANLMNLILDVHTVFTDPEQLGVKRKK
jgi:uncharacterized repeat protein (TIGR02543 family)